MQSPVLLAQVLDQWEEKRENDKPLSPQSIIHEKAATPWGDIERKGYISLHTFYFIWLELYFLSYYHQDAWIILKSNVCAPQWVAWHKGMPVNGWFGRWPCVIELELIVISIRGCSHPPCREQYVYRWKVSAVTLTDSQQRVQVSDRQGINHWLCAYRRINKAYCKGVRTKRNLYWKSSGMYNYINASIWSQLT